MKFAVTNQNEITKSEFDELKELHNLEMFTPDQVGLYASKIASLIEKGENEELSEEESSYLKEGRAELKSLTKYTINENQSGRIVKSDVYTQIKQVEWEDTFEKSTTGEPIKTGVFLDTELNRELGRVGDILQKGMDGKMMKKTKAMMMEEGGMMKKADGVVGMPRNGEKAKEAMMTMMKGMYEKGMDKKMMMKGMMEKYPKEDKKMMKGMMKDMYKGMYDKMMEKANSVKAMMDDDTEDDN